MPWGRMPRLFPKKTPCRLYIAVGKAFSFLIGTMPDGSPALWKKSKEMVLLPFFLIFMTATCSFWFPLRSSWKRVVAGLEKAVRLSLSW